MTPIKPTEAVALLPCPFCGQKPDIDNDASFRLTDGMKYGALQCCIVGPEVRTDYKEVSHWKGAAIAAWNERIAPPASQEAPDYMVLTKDQAHAIAKVIAGRVAKNANVAPQLCFAPVLLALQDMFGGTGPAPSDQAVAWEWRQMLPKDGGMGAWRKISKGRYDRRGEYPNSEFRALVAAPLQKESK